MSGATRGWIPAREVEWREGEGNTFTLVVSPRSYFDGAQHDRPRPGMDVRLGALAASTTGSEGGMAGGRGTPSRWVSPIEGPLRNCRLYRLYHPDHSTSAPLILREPQHERPQPLQHWLRKGPIEGEGIGHRLLRFPSGLYKGHASAHAQGALAASVTHQGRGDWTPTPNPRDGDWGRLDGRVLFVEGVGLLVGVGGVEDGGLAEVAT